MNPLDVIVAEGVRNVLEDDLGRASYRKIEREVHTMYGLTVQEAAGDFAKLDLVLRKFFGRHTANIEVRMFKKILAPEGGRRGGRSSPGIKIKDRAVARTIFESYGDPAKKAILDMMRRPRTIPDVITESGLPKASTYNRIRDLLDGGLLVQAGRAEAADGRSVNRFGATLRKAVFDVTDSGVSVSASLADDILGTSFAFNSVVRTR